MPLKNSRPELLLINSALAGVGEIALTPKQTPSSVVRTTKAKIVELCYPSRLMRLRSFPLAGRASWGGTAADTQIVQLRQRAPSQQPTEARCDFCKTVLDPDGLCQICLNDFINFDAFADDQGVEEPAVDERVGHEPLENTANAGSGNYASIYNAERVIEGVEEEFSW